MEGKTAAEIFLITLFRALDRKPKRYKIYSKLEIRGAELVSRSASPFLNNSNFFVIISLPYKCPMLNPTCYLRTMIYETKKGPLKLCHQFPKSPQQLQSNSI